MRRGHPGFSGWRSENPRHSKPRNGGNSYFRNSYVTLDTGHLQGDRHTSKPNSFKPRFDNYERGQTNHSNSSRYKTHRYNTYHTEHDRPHHRNDRNHFPIFQRNKPHNDKPTNVYSNQEKHYEDTFDNKYYGTKNCKGDIDLRQPMLINQMPSWANDSRSFVQEHYDTNQQNDMDVQKIPLPEYSGHRPPSSDHYGCNPTISTIDKSNSFSRSVDDTVDIVRKRLLNRSDSNNLDNFENRQNVENENFVQNYINVEHNLQEQPTKRRIQRQKPIDHSNCAKIKNKIVNQLFKMDKERIHKLMNNPNSSTKFEYAISSLITESQISFNRHLRSVAEKSLCNPSNEFIQSNDNTIYEDTFMKQMQCILDPQDTIILEDIKPIVMAELNNILQLDNIDHLYDDDNTYRQDDLNQFSGEKYNYQNNPQFHQLQQCEPDNLQLAAANYANIKNISQENYNIHEQKSRTEFYPLFQRRPREIKNNLTTNIPTTSESQFSNLQKNLKVPTNSTDISQLKLFDTDLEQFSEDDDTFTELDNQYHVAVDHNFIEEDEISAQQVSNSKVEPEIELQKECVQEIKKEIADNHTTFSLDQEYESNEHSTIFDVSNGQIDKNKMHDEANNMFQNNNTSNEKHNTTKSTISKSNSRKRSSDQRPPHRKEKRKKSDNNQSLEPSKQILNKNIIINVNDCAKKSSEKCDNAPKSIFNLFFSKDKSDSISKDKKEFSGCDNTCLEKHIQKKQMPKTPDEKSKKSRTKHNSTSSNQSTSPKEINTSSNNQSLKLEDGKTMLKSIDMFTEKPRKLNIHQAHRNTALTPKNNLNKDNNENKSTNKIGLNKNNNNTQIPVKNTVKKMHSKQCQTLELKTFISKFSQTEKKKFAVKAIQTDMSPPTDKTIKSTDAFERMKEIDLEIQVLLQEKFKLYSTFESKDTYANSLQTLGMTVLNVSPYEGETDETHEIILPEDVIVEEFANIPVEELEQIALESVTQEQDSEKIIKETRSRKVSTKSKSLQNKNFQKSNKTPNISLLEQIITDERPLEDIISLDDLEMTPVKKTLNRNKKKQLSKKKIDSKTQSFKGNCFTYELRECSVVLIREDFSVYSKEKVNNDNEMSEVRNSECTLAQNNIVEETVCNDMFDMLDVSEDIIIGDLCEDKGIYDKEVVEHVSIPINEEIILDNSQSSMEDIGPSAVGQGSVCKVYDFSADENLQRDSILVTGNADAVLAIECVENNFLAASLDGSVYYFSGDGQLLSTLRGSNLAVTCLTIVKEKYGTTVYTGSLDSRIRYYDLETGLEKGPECNVLSPIQTMDRAWDTIFVGTRTGFVLQFECKNNMLIPVSTVKFSEQSILALRAMKEGPRKVLLVAARSENVTVKDAQTGLLLRTLEGPKMTVYSLLYEDGKVYCGTSSHQIHVFDYTSGMHVGTHAGGKGAVCLRATGGLVLAGCYDGCVYVYREGESAPRAQLRGPSLMLLSLAVVGTKIIAGYKDRSLYIWKLPLCILEDMIL